MASLRLKSYIPLIKFLSSTLGPDYEIALHSYTAKGCTLIALENGDISGRQLGAPLNSRSLHAISTGEYRSLDYITDYTALSAKGRILRSSTLFLKDDRGELYGLLCINFDDSRHMKLIQDVLKLCHPDNFVEQKYEYRDSRPVTEIPGTEPENLHGSVGGVVEDYLQKYLADKNVSVERITLDEKLEIIEFMYHKGVFILKGAVKEVAKRLGSSQTSVYRYVKNLKTGDRAK